MCRLAIMDNKGFGEFDIKYTKTEKSKTTTGVLRYLDYLEKNNGGHGNGFLLIKDGEIVAYDKGIDLSNEEIYNMCTKIEFDYFIYHTRITSQGTTCDDQCHPFVTNKKDFALCMNGTEHEYGTIGKLLGTSDTDAIFRVYHSLNIDESTLADLSSRFIGFRKPKRAKKGYVFFTNSSTEYSLLEKCTSVEGMVVGSSFPSEAESKKIKAKTYWKEGDKIEFQKTANVYKTYNPHMETYRDYTWRKLDQKCCSCGTINTPYALRCKSCASSYLVEITEKEKELLEELEELTTVECLDNSGCESRLTIGDVYDVLSETEGSYTITDDGNKLLTLSKSRFAEV